MIKKPVQHNPKRRVKTSRRNTEIQDTSKPLIDHINELRARIIWIVISLAVSGIGAYFIHDKLLAIVQKPLGETLYYTSPAGGLNFLIKLCFTFAVIVSLPVIMYHLLKFFSPVLERTHRLALVRYIFASIILAYGGVIFAYIVSLPAALHFLSNFGGQDIASLITADEYYSFALAYLLGFAVLFQLPIVILFINRIKPLRPGGMMKAQRYIILVSFIVAAILTPTPDPINQLIMAAPAVVLYQVSLILVAIVNIGRKDPAKVLEAEPFAEANVAVNITTEAPTKPVFSAIPEVSRQVLATKPLAQQMINDFSFTPQRNIKSLKTESSSHRQAPQQARVLERRPIMPSRPPIQRVQGQMRAMDIFAA